jgi:hypothetical protein
MREISLTSAGLSSLAGKPAQVDTTCKACRRVEAIAREIGDAICRDVVTTLETTSGAGVPL